MTNPLSGIKKAGRPPKSNADRQAEFVAKRSEIGVIPPPADPVRRAACEFDLLKFGITYSIGEGDEYLLQHEPSDKMIPYVVAVQNSFLKGEMVHPRLPRGKGKTTWLKIGDIWASSYGHAKFCVETAANQDNANAILDDIWNFMEVCEPYGADFPEISIPIRALEGRMQRCPVQTVDGKRTKIKRGADRICLPKIDGYPMSGALLVARGKEAGTRGIVKGKQRPDHFGIDDPQNDKSAKSDMVSADIVKWIHHTVLGLCGHSKRAGAVLTTTPMRSGDVSDQCADSELYPQWKTISIPMIIKWPERMDLWDEYLELCRRDKINGFPDLPNATRMYVDNRAEMDRGAEVLDPRDGDPNLEISALQHCFNLLFTVGKESFAAEYQLSPIRADASYTLTGKDVAANISKTPRLVLPPGFYAAVGFVDCMSRDALRWVILGVGPKRVACVIAYGRYPETGMLFEPNSPVPAQNKAFAGALYNLVEQLTALPVKSASNANWQSTIWALGIDRGWKPRIVEWVCNRSSHSSILYPSLGLGWSKYAPEKQDGQRRTNVVAVGDHCFLAQGKGFRFIGHHADYWREYAQRSFLVPALTPGSTSIYGNDPLAHYDFGCEVAAERLSDKGIGANNTEFWKWYVRPGASNHGLDEVTGALALASYLRLFDGQQVLASAFSPSKKPAKAVPVRLRRSRIEFVRGGQHE
jgi:hypothetical protein